jgi:3-hydroxymyristoyl/3-hydroxydecanoyl-(acyl carrier protein) dehydratase
VHAAAREPRLLGENRSGDRVELLIEIPQELFWCEGHFPGFPVVPGVVQLAWAVAQGRRLFPLALGAPVLQVKFRQLIRPGDRLTLALSHDAAKRRLGFAYEAADGLRSSGQITIAP